MKFDNAFLTKAGKVGMQFRNKGAIVTAYRDKESKIVCSESLSDAEKDKLVKTYSHLEKYYV